MVTHSNDDPVACLVCLSPLLTLLDKIPVQEIILDWEHDFAIDISGEFCGLESISQYRCSRCGLVFYFPAIAGSDEFYSQLQQFDWYYMQDKWEFSTALQDLSAGQRVLEVGCGSGEFIKQALSKGVDIEGIELNKKAVRLASEQKLPVRNINLFDLAQSFQAQYDAICMFQVLEHVPNPNPFLVACFHLLKNNGKLLVGVPNNLGFLRHDPRNLLNQPPHHTTHWTCKSLEFLPQLLPLKLDRLAIEPLADYEFNLYVSIQRSRFPNKGLFGFLIQKSIAAFLYWVIKPLRIHRWIPGHTVYVSYRKVEDIQI